MKSPLLLFIFVFLTGFILAPAIGMAWDEPDNIFSGGVWINFIKGGFDRSVFDTSQSEASYFGDLVYPLDRNLAHLPPVHNWVGSAAVLFLEKVGQFLTKDLIIYSFHLSGAFFFAILVATVYRFSRHLSLSVSASLFAASATFLYPTLFGFGFSNSKDIAQASLFSVSLYYLVRGRLLGGAIIWGLALATKFNAIYVPIIWMIWLITKRQYNKTTIQYMLFVIAVGIATAFAVWPYLWYDPINRSLEVIRYFTNVGLGYIVTWDGIRYPVGSGSAMWWYPWATLAIVTPPLLFPLLVLGFIKLLRAARPTVFVLVLWILIPMVRTISPFTAYYDGIRHFLEILPALAIVTGFGVDYLFNLFKKKRLYLYKASHLYIVITIIYIILINIWYFPYSTGYYNIFAREANLGFDRDLGGLSIKEAFDYIHKQPGHLRIWVPVAGHLAWYYLKPGDKYVTTAPEVDYIILINKVSHARKTEFEKEINPVGFTLDHVVRRGEAEFAWVYGRK